MNKKTWFLRVTAIVTVLVMVLSFASCGKKVEEKKADKYLAEIEAMGIFANPVDKALPQTIIHKIVMDHFNAPLPEGKTTKKAIFLGYDGFRADGLQNIADMENSGIMYVKSLGGLYNSFSGGISGVNEQATSTAPSWSAMLTGGWASYNGINDNGQEKNPDADTFLTILARQGVKGSFTTSWREHTGTTYRPDIVNSIKNGLPVEYTHQPDDSGTYYQVMSYVARPNTDKDAYDPDMIFFTFEHTDHAGHNTGFGNQDAEYVEAAQQMDQWGHNIIKTIEARSTYAEEDWLIIIGTDHGGTEYGHGGQSPMERMTWFACNKEVAINDENLNFAITK